MASSLAEPDESTKEAEATTGNSGTAATAEADQATQQLIDEMLAEEQ